MKNNQNTESIRESGKEARNRRVNSYYKDAPSGDSENKSSSIAPLLYILDICKSTEEQTLLDSVFPSELPSTFRTILIALSAKDGITQLALTHATGLKAPTISIALQKMEREEFIYRIPDKHDARALRVYLDEKGQSIKRSFRRKLQSIEQTMLAGFDDYEVNMLNSLLRRMCENASPESTLSEKVY